MKYYCTSPNIRRPIFYRKKKKKKNRTQFLKTPIIRRDTYTICQKKNNENCLKNANKEK